MYHKYIKRFFDIILSLCCIIVSSPILLVTALLVRIKLGSPVIFKQERPGYHNEIFTLYKFRSMTDAVDENGDLLPDKERLPRFGQMLRSTSHRFLQCKTETTCRCKTRTDWTCTGEWEKCHQLGRKV